MATAGKSGKTFKLPETDDSIDGLMPPTGFQKKYETDIVIGCTPQLTDAEFKVGYLVGVVARIRWEEARTNMSRTSNSYQVPTHWYIGNLEDLTEEKSIKGKENVSTILRPCFGLSVESFDRKYRVWALQEAIETKHKPKALHDKFVAQLYEGVPKYMQKLGVELAEGLKLPDGRVIARKYGDKEE